MSRGILHSGTITYSVDHFLNDSIQFLILGFSLVPNEGKTFMYSTLKMLSKFFKCSQWKSFDSIWSLMQASFHCIFSLTHISVQKCLYMTDKAFINVLLLIVYKNISGYSSP